MQIMYKRKGRMICFYDIDNGCVLVGKILWHPKGNVDKVKRINKAIDDYYDSINRNWRNSVPICGTLFFCAEFVKIEINMFLWYTHIKMFKGRADNGECKKSRRKWKHNNE